MLRPLKESITIAGPRSVLRGKERLNLLHHLAEADPSCPGSCRKGYPCPTPRRSLPWPCAPATTPIGRMQAAWAVTSPCSMRPAVRANRLAL